MQTLNDAYEYFTSAAKTHFFPHRVDVHAHIVPQFYKEWLESKGIIAGGLPIPSWSEESCLECMNTIGVETSILSVSTPGVVLYESGVDKTDWSEAKDMARRINEYCNALHEKNPKNFGFFATLLLPDVAASINEAKYALETLHADGVILLTNVGNQYIGDTNYEPLMEYLNSKNCVVFIHPAELPSEPIDDIPPYVADFLLNTVRAAINICKNGWHEKFPNIKFILSHGGGFLPYACVRLSITAGNGDEKLGMQRLKSFYFDIALSGTPYALPSLLAFADKSKIVFGSDFPYANAHIATGFTALFSINTNISHEDKNSINRNNALELFPRLKEYK